MVAVPTGAALDTLGRWLADYVERETTPICNERAERERQVACNRFMKPSPSELVDRGVGVVAVVCPRCGNTDVAPCVEHAELMFLAYYTSRPKKAVGDMRASIKALSVDGRSCVACCMCCHKTFRYGGAATKAHGENVIRASLDFFARNVYA